MTQEERALGLTDEQIAYLWGELERVRREGRGRWSARRVLALYLTGCAVCLLLGLLIGGMLL